MYLAKFVKEGQRVLISELIETKLTIRNHEYSNQSIYVSTLWCRNSVRKESSANQFLLNSGDV